MDPTELIEKAETCLDEIDTLQGKAAEVETDEELEKVEEKIDAKEKEYSKLKRQIKAAKAQKERREAMGELSQGLEPEDPGNVAPEADGKGESSGVEVTQSESREHQKLFLDYMGGKSLNAYSTEERNFLHPDSESFDKGATGVRLPDGFKSAMFGKRFGKSMELYGGKAVQSDNESDGYLVDEDYLAELLELEPEPGHLLGRVTAIPVKGGTVKVPRLQQTDSNEYGGMSFTWGDEGSAKGETEPTFEQISIDCHEVNGYTEISETMIRRNAVAANNIVTRLYREGMQDEMDSVIISGSGTGQPQGITNATGVRTVPRDTSNEVSANDIIDVKHAILPHHRANAAYIVHDDVEADIEKDDVSRENPIISGGLLKNYAYEVTARQPGLGSDGDVIFGDASAYYLAMEEDIVVKRSEDYKFRNNLVSFAVFAVIGGQLALPRGMAILSSSTS